MIQLHVTYTMKPGIEPKAFYEALAAAKIPETCQSEHGNLGYTYYYPANHSNQLFLLEIWADEEALTAHQQTAHFKAIPAIKEQYVTDTLLNRYEVH